MSEQTKDCKECFGTGNEPQMRSPQPGRKILFQPCRVCGGSGKVPDKQGDLAFLQKGRGTEAPTLSVLQSAHLMMLSPPRLGAGGLRLNQMRNTFRISRALLRDQRGRLDLRPTLPTVGKGESKLGTSLR